MSEVFNIRDGAGINPVSLKKTLEANDAQGVDVVATELTVTADSFTDTGLGPFLQSRGLDPVESSSGENGGGTFIIHAKDSGGINVPELQKMLEANGTGIELQSPSLKVVIQAARKDLRGLFASLGHEVVAS